MLFAARKALQSAPDISACRGRSAVASVKTEAQRWLTLLRDGGVNPTTDVVGNSELSVHERIALGGYRSPEDAEAISDAMLSLASQSLSRGMPVVMRVVQRDGAVYVEYGGLNASALGLTLPGAKVLPSGVAEGSAMSLCSVVLGVPGSRIDYDAILDISHGDDMEVEAVCLPGHAAADQLGQLSAIRGSFAVYRTTKAMGNSEVDVEVREVVDLLDECDALEEDLLRDPGRARLLFVVRSSSRGCLGRVVSLLEGGCALGNQNRFKTAFSRSWEVPHGHYPVTGSGVPYAWEMGLSAAVLALLPPRESHVGFEVRFSWLGSERRSFPGIGAPFDGGLPSYALGRCENDGAMVSVPISQVASAFVTGMPGCGKTTLLLNVVKSAYEAGVPTCVIEAGAKREFAEALAGEMRALEVMGVGPAAANMTLRFNPLSVPPQVQVAKHAEDLAAALLMASDDDPEQPLPAAIERLVKDAYLRAGWGLSDVAWDDPDRPWPTIADLDVESYADKLGYESRVRLNLRQAVLTRLDRLMTYQDMLCSERNFHFRRITAGHTVLELGGMGERNAAFVSSCLLRWIIEWASTLPDLPKGSVPRLLVCVDELNAILSFEGPHRPISHQLARAFRELRSKGVVLVVAAQQPSGAEEVMPNAALRIAFRQDWQDDADVICGAFNLSERHRMLLGTLPDHHAIVKLPSGRSEAIPVETVPFRRVPSRGHHAACVTCTARLGCARCSGIARSLLPGIERRMVDALGATATGDSLNPAAIRLAATRIRGSLPDATDEVTHCLVGLCLEEGGAGFEESRRVLVWLGQGTGR